MSDTDILVIVRDHSGVIREEAILSSLPEQYQTNATFSWYGRARIATMFREGHLFAWHLYYESIPILDKENFFTSLGKPDPYSNALVDIDSFLVVLSGISDAIEATPSNVVYELGLLYVCTRNIAMAASWHLSATPDFSRYSPFNLPAGNLTFSEDEHKLCMLARMASQRGGNPQIIPAKAAMNLSIRMLNWGYEIQDIIRTKRLCA